LLRLLLRTLADIRAERVEACLLLVAERVIEFLQRRPQEKVMRFVVALLLMSGTASR